MPRRDPIEPAFETGSAPNSSGTPSEGRTAGTIGRAPVAVALALLAANTLAVSVKAWDEHRSQQAEALSVISRDGVVAASRLEARLMAQAARLAAGDRAVMDGFGAPFELDSSGRVRSDVAEDWHDRVRSAARQGERLVAINDSQVVVIGKRENGGYLASSADLDALAASLSAEGWGRVEVGRDKAALSAQFSLGRDGGRQAIGCATLASTELKTCVVRAAPTLDFADYSRLVFYLLLIGTPILGGFGVWSLLRQRERALAVEAQARRDAEQRLSMSVDGAGVGVWTYDVESERLTLNNQFAALLETGTQRSMHLQEFVDRLRPEDRDTLTGGMRELMRLGVLAVTVRVGSHERPTFIDMRGKLSDDAREASGVAFDVSRQRIAERRAMAAERRLKEAIDVFTGPFAEWDSRRRLIYCNRAFGVTFNIPNEVLQRGATYESIAARIARLIRSETPSSTDSRVRETELVDGRWLQMADRPTLDGRIITFGLDITALKRQEEAVLKSERKVRRAAEDLSRAKDRADQLAQMHAEEKRKAEAANKAKSVFLANTGHELRTPLVAINGFSEMLIKQPFGPLGNERYVEYAKDVNTAGIHLLDVINDILDMAKIESGKMTISRAAMDVEDAIDEAVRILRQRIQAKGLELIVDVPKLPEIDGDHRSVRQMMLNLIGNAFKFTEKGSITVKARLEDDFIRISVKDTGIGIPESALDRLGKPFEQVEDEFKREFKGTGLGLALTRSFAEMHGGRMEIASKLSEGTEVSIMLPVTPPQSASIAAE